ncbi:MAG: hypothetical protein QM706_14760 [Nitrospira sp.]
MLRNPRIMFQMRAGSRSGLQTNHDVDRLADVAVKAGARNVEGPGYDEGPGYYAVFFEIETAIVSRSVTEKTKPRKLFCMYRASSDQR